MLVNSARWIGLAQVAKIGSQLIGLAVLARLLTPADYGLMAMVSVFVALAFLLRDMGTAAAIIQKADLDEETVNAVFWLNAMTGFGLLIITALISPLVAMAFRAPQLTKLLILAAIAFPISALTIVNQALLERRSQFRTVARIEIVSTAVALLLAIIAAYHGLGAYSLVLQAVAASVFASAQYGLAAKWLPRRRVQWRRLRQLLGFTGNLVGFNFINYFSRNADSMIIGRFLGSSALGSYSVAYKLMLFPLQNLTFVLTRAMYPVLCRHQNEPDQMRDLYLRALRALSMVTAPLMAGALVLREPLIRIVFGPQWQQSAEVLAWLAPTGFLQSIISTTGGVLMARGRTDVLFRLGLLSAALQICSFFIGLPYGVVGVACCYFIANALNAVPALYFTARQIDSPLGSVLAAVAPSAVSASIVAAAIMLAAATSPTGLPFSLAGISLVCLAGALLYAALLRFAFGQNLADIGKLVRSR